MKILVDMNLSASWVTFLTDANIEARHWSMLGTGTAPDSEIMAYASLHSYAILTRDLDFSAALARGRMHAPSVIQIRAKQTSTRLVGQQVLQAIKERQPEIEQGALVTVAPNRSRLHLLPLRPKHDF
jgi:predicted nuclease of predicted toxin-antitoxin system